VGDLVCVRFWRNAVQHQVELAVFVSYWPPWSKRVPHTLSPRRIVVDALDLLDFDRRLYGSWRVAVRAWASSALLTLASAAAPVAPLALI
jgi:hypothetical protein